MFQEQSRDIYDDIYLFLKNIYLLCTCVHEYLFEEMDESQIT